MIDGVILTALRQVHDERGKVMSMLRCDDAVFNKFGEIYFSHVHHGAIKGWHLHKKMTLNYSVPFGKVKKRICTGEKIWILLHQTKYTGLQHQITVCV